MVEVAFVPSTKLMPVALPPMERRVPGEVEPTPTLPPLGFNNRAFAEGFSTTVLPVVCVLPLRPV